MIVVKCLGDSCMHFAKLRAVAFVEDDHYMTIKNCMSFIAFDKSFEFLNGGDDDACIFVFELSFEYGRAGVTVGSSFFKLIILAHGLIVQIFAVNHKEHFVHIGQLACQLSSFEAGKRLARTGCMPDVTAGFDGSQLFVIGADFYFFSKFFR